MEESIMDVIIVSWRHFFLTSFLEVLILATASETECQHGLKVWFNREMFLQENYSDTSYSALSSVSSQALGHLSPKEMHHHLIKC